MAVLKTEQDEISCNLVSFKSTVQPVSKPLFMCCYGNARTFKLIALSSDTI